MDFETKMNSAYKSEVTFLSIMTFVFGLLSLFLGYLILPLSAGFYAALLLFERKESRVFSYVIPLLLLVINVLINGFYSVEAISYVVVGAIIFAGFEKKKNKAFTMFCATAALIVLMIFSLMLFAFDKVGTFKISALNDFYLSAYESGKDAFVKFLTSFKSVDEEGAVFHNYNPSEAVDLYNSFIFSLVPLSIIFALILVGLSSKLLCSRVRKFNFKDERVNEWLFVTSPFLAYSYLIITAFVSLSAQGVVGVSLSFVSSILLAIYFYIGIVFLFKLLVAKKNRLFAFITLALVLVVFSSYAPQIISFVGVFVNNITYKNLYPNNADT